jgi:hypothetical protein
LDQGKKPLRDLRVLRAWELLPHQLCCPENGEQIFQMEEASGRGGRPMDRARTRLTDTAVETAEIRALLDNGLPQFFAESVSGAGIGAGVRDVTGVDPDVGGGGKRDEQFSQKRG